MIKGTATSVLHNEAFNSLVRFQDTAATEQLKNERITLATLAAKTCLIWIWGFHIKEGWTRSPSTENAVHTRSQTNGRYGH